MKKVGLPINKADHKFTYAEYSLWPDDERWELINGIAYNMSPAPTSTHQRLCGNLFTEISIFLKKNPANPLLHPLMSTSLNIPIRNSTP